MRDTREALERLIARINYGANAGLTVADVDEWEVTGADSGWVSVAREVQGAWRYYERHSSGHVTIEFPPDSDPREIWREGRLQAAFEVREGWMGMVVKEPTRLYMPVESAFPLRPDEPEPGSDN
jgi:hypothetical protein